LSALIEDAATRARAQFLAEAIAEDRIKLTPFLKCRYQNQEHSVEVGLAYGPIAAETVADVISRFHTIYEREYTYRLDAPVEVVGLHLVASAEVGKLRLAPLPKSGTPLEAARKGRRLVDYATEGVHQADIYDAEKLEPGMTFPGPAVVEDPATTVVVHPGQNVAIDAYGNIHIEMAR
jgi:N-methylhydantoinase A